MCLFNTPSAPKPALPDPVQQSKSPDTPQVMAQYRKARSGSGAPGGPRGFGSTVLTGEAGAAPTAGQLGKATLLGA